MLARVSTVVLVVVLAASACNGDIKRTGSTTTTSAAPAPTTTALPPLIKSELDVQRVAPESVLVATGFAFGAARPSVQAALDVYRPDKAVLGAAVRLVTDTASLAPAADMTVLALDPTVFHDREVFEGYLRGFIQGIGASVTAADVAGVRTLRAGPAADGSLLRAYLHENLLIVARGRDDDALARLVAAQLTAIAAGQVGTADLATPMRVVQPGELFVNVPTVGFVAYPATETPPPAPVLSGASGAVTGIETRLVAVAGERRGTTWVIGTSAGAFPTAESLTPAIDALATARYGSAPTSSEVGGRVVVSAGPGPGGEMLRVFRYQDVVVVIEGIESDQLDAIVSAWSAALGPG
jgi:hypothetical protein